LERLLVFLSLLSLLLFAGCLGGQKSVNDSMNSTISDSTTMSAVLSTTSSTAEPSTTFTSSTTTSTSKKKKSSTSTTTTTIPLLEAKTPVLASQKTPYSYINYAGSIYGEPFFVVRQGREKMFIYFEGKEIGREYESAGGPRSIGGKLAYVAQNKSRYFLVYDGVEGPRYDFIEPPIDVGGKPAYIASRGGRKYAVYDGKELGDKYDNLESFIANINGVLCFAGKKDRRNYLVCNGREIGDSFDSVESPYAAEFDGKLLYIGVNGTMRYAIYDGKLMGEGYHSIYPPFNNVNGKLAFLAEDEINSSDGTLAEKYYIVYDGKETGKDYDSVEVLYPGATAPEKASFKEAGGKIAYVGVREGLMFIALDGTKVGDSYGRVRDLTVLNDKIAFIGTRDEGATNFVLYDGQEISQGFNEIFSLREAGGRLVYIVWDPNQMKYFLVSGSQKVGEGFDGIEDNEFYLVNGKILFIGKRKGELYIVREK